MKGTSVCPHIGLIPYSTRVIFRSLPGYEISEKPRIVNAMGRISITRTSQATEFWNFWISEICISRYQLFQSFVWKEDGRWTFDNNTVQTWHSPLLGIRIATLKTCFLAQWIIYSKRLNFLDHGKMYQSPFFFGLDFDLLLDASAYSNLVTASPRW